MVDLFGEIDVDGTGTGWDHLDGWAYRVSNSPDSPVFTLTDWFFSGINAFDGALTNATASYPMPIGTYTFDPAVDATTQTMGEIKNLFR